MENASPRKIMLRLMGVSEGHVYSYIIARVQTEFLEGPSQFSIEPPSWCSSILFPDKMHSSIYFPINQSSQFIP